MDYNGRILKAVKWIYDENQNINKVHKSSKDNVILGRTFSLGGLFGYYFAKYLFQKTKYIALIDMPISLNNRKQPIYPDILILEKSKLKAIIELKLDLGFLNLDEFGISYNNRIKKYSYNKNKNKFLLKQNELKNAKYFNYNLKDAYGKIVDRQKIKIQKGIKKAAIILSRKNDHGRFDSFNKSVKDANYKTFHLLNNTQIRVGDNWTRIEKDFKENGEEINNLIDYLKLK